MVSLVTEQLSDIRSNQVNEFQEIFKKCETMANLSNVAITVPRIVQRQTLRANFDHYTPEKYYRRSIFIPFVDCLLQQLHDRFQGKTKKGICIKGIFLIPSNLENINIEVNKIKET